MRRLERRVLQPASTCAWLETLKRHKCRAPLIALKISWPCTEIREGQRRRQFARASAFTITQEINPKLGLTRRVGRRFRPGFRHELHHVGADGAAWKGEQDPVTARPFYGHVGQGLGCSGLHAGLRIKPGEGGVEFCRNNRDDAEQGETPRLSDDVGLDQDKISLRKVHVRLIAKIL